MVRPSVRAALPVALAVSLPVLASPRFVELPPSPEYLVRNPGGADWGEPEVVDALRFVARVWRHDHPRGPLLQFNDLSREGGGPLPGHVSHQKGVDVDVVTRNPNVTDLASADPTGENVKLARELAGLFRRYGATLILWNGDASGLDYVRRWPRHDDHFHVRFAPEKRLIPWRVLDVDLARGVAPLAGLSRPAPASPGDRRTLRKGDVGAEVAELQRLLGAKGYAVAPDEVFGAGTERAVERFQRDRALSPMDGIVGPRTWRALFAP